MLRPPPLSSLHHCKADNLLTYRSEKENELVMKKRNQIFVCLAVMLVFLLCMRLCAAEETANVIVAGRHTVSLEQAQQEVDDLIAAYRNTYGIAFIRDDYIHIRNRALNSLLSYCIMDNVVEDYGLDTFTQEESESLMQQAEEAYEQTLEYYIEDYKAIYAGFMDDDTAKEMARDYLERSGCTIDSLYRTAMCYAGYDRLYADVTKDVAIEDDEEVYAYYMEKHVEPDRKLFADHIDQYELYTSAYGQNVYYIPKGYRSVSRILLTYPEDIQTEISIGQAKREAIQTLLEDKTKTEEECQLLNREAELLQAQLLAIREKAVPALQDSINEIQARIMAGESFDSLIAAYGQDEEMLSCPEGYMVHEASIVYETEFRDAAMSLEQIGDISEPVLTDSGIQFICYLSDVPEGAVQLNQDAFVAMAEEALETKKAKVFQNAMDDWSKKYAVAVYPEKIVLPDDK